MGSTLVLAPLACGGAQDEAHVQRAPNKQFEPSRREVNVPDTTARHLRHPPPASSRHRRQAYRRCPPALPARVALIGSLIDTAATFDTTADASTRTL